MIAVYNLEISIFCPALITVPENCATDRAGVAPSSVIGMNVDCVNPNVIPVKDSEAGSDDPIPVVDGDTDGLFGNSAVHGRNYHAVHDIGRTLQRKQSLYPGVGDEAADVHRYAGTEVPAIRAQGLGHDMGNVLPDIALLSQERIKTSERRGDILNIEGCPIFGRRLAVGDFVSTGA